MSAFFIYIRFMKIDTLQTLVLRFRTGYLAITTFTYISIMSAFVHQSNLSFVVVDPTSNSIVGGDFLFNYVDGVECVEHHHCMQPIVDLLRAVEAPARDRLEATGGHRGLRDHLKASSLFDELETSSEIV